MLNRILFWALAMSAGVEVLLGLGVLFLPEKLMGVFGIAQITPDLSYLAAIVGWFCLGVGGVVAISARWVASAKREGVHLALLLGVWWIGIGLYLTIQFHRPDHLVLDTAKGLLIASLAWASLRQRA